MLRQFSPLFEGHTPCAADAAPLMPAIDFRRFFAATYLPFFHYFADVERC